MEGQADWSTGLNTCSFIHSFILYSLSVCRALDAKDTDRLSWSSQGMDGDAEESILGAPRAVQEGSTDAHRTVGP